MKTKKESYPPVHIGTSFMLVIFIILCMIIFAVLSLSSAHKDYEYSLKSARRASEYYAANNLAEEKLAEIDTFIESGNVVPSGSIIEFTVPVNDTELLQIILNIKPEQTPHYTIAAWKTIPTEEWTGETSLPVFRNE